METLDCAEHGPQEITFACRHLLKSLSTKKRVGFFNSSEPRGDAWCNACDAVRIREGGKSGDWNERSEAFAGIKIVCGQCYDRIRKLNR